MGIYIDMEMPEDGLKNIMILADGRVFQFSGYGNPKLLGTAVSVPPHGRLIDADALMKRMWDETDCMISVPATFVRDAPAIIPASEEIN